MEPTILNEIVAELKQAGTRTYGAKVYDKIVKTWQNVTLQISKSILNGRATMSLVVPLENGERMYIPVAPGLPEKASYDVILQVSTAGGSGKLSNGNPWNVPAGKKRLLAV